MPTAAGEPGPYGSRRNRSAPRSPKCRAEHTYQPKGFDQAVTFRLDSDDHTYLPQVRPIRDADGDTLGAAIVLNDVTRFRLLDQFKSDLVATVSHESQRCG